MFIKLNNDDIIIAENYVKFPDGIELSNNIQNIIFPFRGWYFFNTEDEARLFFNLPLKIEQESDINNFNIQGL